MDPYLNVQPLPHRKRHRTFIFLVLVFLISLPFLYMYATGYKFDIQKPTNIVSTGGLYVGVERLGAEIYIDDELVRETRAFRKAFYAQGLNAGTHKVHVQKEGFHTWVKELPVTKRLVTEAEAFNFPLVPSVRVISKMQTATGTMVIASELMNASSTNEVIATSTKKTANFVANEEYTLRLNSFASTSTSTQSRTTPRDIFLNATSTSDFESATTTIISGGVKLYESGEELYAAWVGSFEQMPYYYCAPDFPRYEGRVPGVATTTATFEDLLPELEDNELVMHPVQSVSEDIECDRTIRMDRMNQVVQDFHFYPGNTDLVIMTLDTGVYAVEIDDRSWQNIQPIYLGNNLRTVVEEGSIYVFDGEVIYQIVVSLE